MTHPVLDYLISNDVASLASRGIYARWSTVNPRKCSLNYDQIEAVDGDPLVNVCRGLVIRQDHDGPQGAAGAYSVLAWPFDRFYNLGSPHAAPLDWETAVFEEKLDGTLCILYWDGDLGKWCVATRSVPDADVPTASGATFAELFWRVEGYVPPVSPPQRPSTLCYELTGPGNQIVIPYPEWTLTRLGQRDHTSGQMFVGDAPRFSFSNIAKAKAWLAEQPGTAIEGFVVRDAQGRRVKVKSAQYLAVAKVMTTAGSDVGLVELHLGGCADDARPWLPAPRQARLDDFGQALRMWRAAINSFGAELKQRFPVRKDAALHVQSSNFAEWISPLMAIYSGQCDDALSWLNHAREKNGQTVPKLTAFLTKVYLETP